MNRIKESILKTIGDTPVVRSGQLQPGQTVIEATRATPGSAWPWSAHARAIRW